MPQVSGYLCYCYVFCTGILIDKFLLLFVRGECYVDSRDDCTIDDFAFPKNKR